MFCHSHRSRFIVLASTSSLPVTYPYLISDPLPSGITQLGIRIRSHDQGSSDDPTAGRWTWFEASFLRPQTGSSSDPIICDSLHLVREAPEAFRQVFQQNGWDFIELPDSSEASCMPERSSQRSLALFANTEAPGWETQNCTFSFDGSDGPPHSKHLTLSIQEGDRVVVWARAQFPGWQNHVAEIHIGLSGVNLDESLAKAHDLAAVPEFPKILNRSSEQYLLLWEDREETDPSEEAEAATSVTQTATSVTQMGSISASRPKTLDHPVMPEKARPTPETILRHELNALHPGEWIICAHDCRCAEHGHPVSECDSSDETCLTQPTLGKGLRGVHNPCTHYCDTEPDNDVRLLRVCPTTSHSDAVQLIVERVPGPLSKASYVALSYCWGELQEVDEITLNHVHRMPDSDGKQPGVCMRHTFNVTKNLHRALQYIACNARTGIRKGQTRHMGQEGWWVDAICISQKNMNERAQQVARMGQIFSQAFMVTVWLDLHPDISEQAFRTIKLLGRILREKFGDAVNGYNMNKEQLDYLSTNGPVDHEVCDGDSHVECRKVFSGLAGLYGNSWFRRIWVIQEICKADANAVVIAHPHLSISFNDLLVGYRFSVSRHHTIVLPQMPNLWYDLVLHLSEPSGRMKWTNTPDGWSANFTEQKTMDKLRPSQAHFNILTLFSRGLPFEATEPRDKLFALLGLALETCMSMNIPRELSVRYDVSVTEVFVDFTWYCLRQYKDLRVFEGVKRTARREFYVDHPFVLPANYDYPPQSHPTWAVWHACKAVWDAHVAHPSRYLGRSITKSRFLDVTLLDIDPNPFHLPLCGRYLDEVDRVIQVPSTERSDDIAFVPIPSTPRALHTVWRQLKEALRYHGLNPDDGQKCPCAYATDDDLFDQFLYTVICDAPLRNLGDENHGLDQDPTQRTPLSKNAAIMEMFLSYWLQETADNPDAQRKCLLDSELPPDAIQTCHRLIEAGRVSTRSALIHSFTLHHILGQCFFVTKKGFIGLGPVGTRSGDRLVALRGACLASVLRCQDDQVIEWSMNGLGWMFVGEGYVHAWMDGRFVEQMVANGQDLDELYVLV